MALEYSDIDQLPTVVASGTDSAAEKLIEFAKSHHIPVREDATLAEMLKEVSVGAAITPQTFRLVAEVITFLYAADKEWREKHDFLKPVAEK